MEHPSKNESQTNCLVNCNVNKVYTAQVAASSIIIIAMYIAFQLLADIGSLKIAVAAGFSIDCGTLVYPITFTIRDIIHKKLGKNSAKVVIVCSAAINLIMSLFFNLVTLMTPDPTWELQSAWEMLLGPVWRIVIASIAAELISEFLDTEVYHLWVTKITRKYQWSRVLVSNAASIPVDSIVFSFIAFWGTMPVATVWSIVFSNIIVKSFVTLVSIPAIYLVKDGDKSLM